MQVVTTEGTQGWGLIRSEGSPVSISLSQLGYERPERVTEPHDDLRATELPPPSRLSKLPAGSRGDMSKDDLLSLLLDLEVGERRMSSDVMSAVQSLSIWRTVECPCEVLETNLLWTSSCWPPLSG